MYSLYDRVLGCLVTAGMGDGIGAPTEAMSRQEILEKYGRITGFVDGSTNLVAWGNRTAEITDDTSQMYEMVKAVIRCGGELTAQEAGQALVRWSENYPRYFPRNAGPTTRNVIERLKAGEDPCAVGRTGGRYELGTSNGAIMRIAGAGLDVFSVEPIEPDNPLLTMDNCVCLPHSGGHTTEARARTLTMAVEQIARVLDGQQPTMQVNQL